MKKTEKRKLTAFKVTSFATSDKIMAKGGLEANPTCVPETCTNCPGGEAFA
jgi:hypothetical protein